MVLSRSAARVVKSMLVKAVRIDLKVSLGIEYLKVPAWIPPLMGAIRKKRSGVVANPLRMLVYTFVSC
eukprot:1043225-Heterocapsa_arctica.AAC.1